MSDVHENLPAVPENELEPMIFDGEVVEENAAAVYPGAAAARPVIPPPAMLVLRHGAYVAVGVIVVVRRWHLRRTRHERMMRSAEAAGDHETALAWAQQKENERHHRGAQRVAMIHALVDLAKALPVLGAAALILMVVTGISLAVVRHRFADLDWPFMALFHAVALAVEVATVAWTVAVIGLPAVTVAGLYWLGRTAGPLAPSWVVGVRPQDDDRGLVVTADAIVLALQHLPIQELKKAFKDGWTPTFHTTPVMDGEGYWSVFSVPMGVTPAMIADQQEIFARNLHRAKTEAWTTDAERGRVAPAGYAALWVANPGVLDRPAPEWPLLHGGTADVFKGVPAGVGPRGDQLSIRIVANNLVCGGIMGMGKSNACRVVMLGAALDPIAELWVHVFAYNGDFDCYAPRLARYVKGAEDEHLTAALDTLRELYAEVGRREQRLADLGAKKVTRDLAMRHPDLRPRLTLFSECHVLFGSKEFGEEATELAANVMRRARKTALWLGFDTQDARKDAIPPKIVGLVSVNICFYVKTWRANDGFLGDGAFQAGIRATELRPERDIGRSVATGVSDAQFELLKWHYIFSDDDTGQDDAAAVIERAMKNLAPGTRIEAALPLTAIEVHNLLDDLAEVVKGSERVKLRDVIGLLRHLAPGWGRYRTMTAKQLEEDLADEGVRVVNTSGTKWLDPAVLHLARAEREAGE